MKHIAVFCATGLGVVLVACGSLDSNTSSAPTLATVQGSLGLVSPDSLGPSSSNDVRVAVVWRVNGPGQFGPGQFNVAEDLPVKPVFPASFTIALDGPPPEAAMNGPATAAGMPAPVTGPAAGPPPVTAAAGGPPPDAGVDAAAAENSQAVMLLDTPTSTAVPSRYAIGTVVAYLDQNHNGKLDLVPDNATAYVDRLLAANEELSIEYFEGPIHVSDTFGHSAKDGYNLLKIPLCDLGRSPGPGDVCPFVRPPVGDAGACLPEWLGMDTPYPLTIDSSPAVASVMCEDIAPAAPAAASGPAGPFDPSVQPAQYPLPGDQDLCCDPDGSQYLYFTCMEDPARALRGDPGELHRHGIRPADAGAFWLALPGAVKRTPRCRCWTDRLARRRSPLSMRSTDSSFDAAAGRSCATMPSPTTRFRRRS